MTAKPIIALELHYPKIQILIKYVRAFMLLTETLEDVRRTSMSRPNRLALHQLTISKYMEQPSF